jgi:sugar (pentulose or hexulose) kinase
MIVLEKALSKVYPEIDMVTTPAGRPVAMVHCNNCTGDIDAWIKLFLEIIEKCGLNIKKAHLYDTFYESALKGDKDCGGLLSYNFISGEHNIDIEEGRPLFVRMPDSNFTLANFAPTLLFSTMGTLQLGMNILVENEKIKIDSLLGHGGLFKTKGVGQSLMAAAFNTPVSVMEESAGEGGAWGIALLAAFLQHKEDSLENFLEKKVFAGKAGTQIKPDQKDVESFKIFMERYTAGLDIEKTAIECMKQGIK